MLSAPSPKTKAQLDAKTSAINATPNDKYDINAIKQDAKWLSENASINEVEALRAVVLEFQGRSHSHLTGPLSTQDVLNLQEAAGVSNAQALGILGPVDVSTATDAELIWTQFEMEESRRRRLLDTLLNEQRCFMATADCLVTFLLYQPPSLSATQATELRQDILKDVFGSEEQGVPNISSFVPLANKYLEFLPESLDATQLPEKLDARYATDELGIAFLAAGLTRVAHAMSVVFQILDKTSVTFAAPETVSNWFTFVNNCQWLTSIEVPDDSITELVVSLRSLICAISLTLLNTGRALAFLEQEVDLVDHEKPYLREEEVLDVVHNAVIIAANNEIAIATPVIFAWSIILQNMRTGYLERVERRDLLQAQRAQDGFEVGIPRNGRRNSAGSIVSIEQSPYDHFLTTSVMEQDNQIVETLAMAATARGLVYDVIIDISRCSGYTEQASFSPVVGSRIRLVFVQLLKLTFPYVGYQADPVTALLAVLSGEQSYWGLSSKNALISPDQEVAAVALKDADLLNCYITESLNRYPYESLPFASFCRILSSCLSTDDRSDLLLNFLLKTPTLTFELGNQWNDYELAHEEDNSNAIRLVSDVPLFAPTSTWKRRSVAAEMPFCIPAGTSGRFVSDHGKITQLDYEHSTLALLGKRLEVNLSPETYQLTLGTLEAEEVAESIHLLAAVLRATVLRAQEQSMIAATEAGLNILQEASKALPRTKDIITVICDTLDHYIQPDANYSEGAQISVMSACLKFLHATLPLSPGRVWSYMARCELLYSGSRTGRLSALTGTLEMLAERYELLSSAVNLFSGLVNSAVSSAVHRKSSTKSGSRQQTDDNPWLGTSDKILDRVCLSVAQTSLDIFENSATWRFSPEINRSVIVRDVVKVMDQLVSAAFSMGNPESPEGLTSFLTPAAKFVVESFLTSTSSGSLRFQPLIASILVALQLPKTAFYPRRTTIISERLAAALNLCSTLLRVSDYLDQPSSTLQTQLFKISSLIARCYAARDSFRVPSLTLLGTLVESSGKGSNEPPSLLGYLGPQVSKSFIHILQRLDQPYDRPTTASAVWKFFSTILRNRQQWMANCLLNGKPPREALQGDGKIGKISPDSILHVALGKLRHIATLPSEETMVVLDFFTSAQNYWPWTIFAMQKDNTFLDHLRAYVHDLKSPSVVGKANPTEATYQARIAAYIAETFAMQLYHLRQMGREEIFSRDVINDLDYFLRDGVQVSGYNTSLHVNFAKNFKTRFGCSLDDFKTTSLVQRDLGPGYFYALDYADAMLGFDAGWVGPRQNGFRSEMETANLNLSLVDAQIVSAQSCQVQSCVGCCYDFLLTNYRLSSMLGNTCCSNSASVFSRGRTRRLPNRCFRWLRSA